MKSKSTVVIALTLLSCASNPKPVPNISQMGKTAEMKGVDASGKAFQKHLSMQNFSFDISTTGEGSIQQLTIRPYGLSKDNSEFTLEIVGIVTDAEIADLNADGFPEILIYTTSAGSGSYGNVIGYSVSNGKSMSRISFPNIADNPEAGKGYMGHDQFRIADNRLVQQFRTYKSGDVNATPTGNIRQILYKLKDGESSRIFVVDKIVEFPSNK